MSDLYIGLMSGTSMDGVDVALVDFSKIQPIVIAYQSYPYPTLLLSQLHRLCSSSENEVVSMGHADRAVAICFAEAVNRLLAVIGVKADKITAIGSHGQTIRHHPNGSNGFTLQIGDPNTLAVLTGIDVVADFRRKDIALGGQGAPLAPAFHQAVFRHSQHSRVVLNIGGIANLTYIPKDPRKPVLGFDTGPGNALMDAWCKKHLQQAFDKNGVWAAQGSRDVKLLRQLASDDYFGLPAPKSTGREKFNLAWLEDNLAALGHQCTVESVQATLCMLTCCSIAQQINLLGDVEQVFVCGGGAQNDFLMDLLANELVEAQLSTTEELGILPDEVEAVAFAWLAFAHKNGIAGNLPSVTGASKKAILGGYFPAQ
ncbi:anhydro-N-acetylmuramic acid kinase [Aliiglaciecola sp. LCG003]|uniref:anhydro-N-acetylmuramic acid kinase n=1 Tax=Aliiglaciecola sp. LCG003 TaxID=3053655 RepID=UPI002572A67E|nr:anhydro-N-acetylmuramic acid kinase [Aliiglaciecola sp. LCG003]WJG08895.1 anhydro-N-acetylmuramic acid kinase [Aliiglaciecola sp. LCG003]